MYAYVYRLPDYTKHNIYVTSSAKTHLVRAKIILILLSQPIDTHNGHPSPVYSLNIILVYFSGGQFAEPPKSLLNNGGYQLGDGDLKLLPLLTGRLCA